MSMGPTQVYLLITKNAVHNAADTFGTLVTASQIQSQQSNVALLSALILTVQFAFLYGFPSIWSDLIQSSYLAGFMDDDQLDVLHEVMHL